ncbi:MAG: beta-lactamase family protein [Actinobacteria bacterium]|nr:beta-lactamase family protein [Actinomycetota bacterium]
MDDLQRDIERVARDSGFSGVVRVDVADEVVVARAHGLARRDLEVPNTVDTRFGIASGTKGVTALTVMSLVEAGILALDTPARALLGDDLPLVPDDVTVGHLLAHRSGIGDYVDEDAIGDITAFLLPVPVAELTETADYLRVLEGHPAVAPAGERFAYCNSGYVVLALLAERATGRPFRELVHERVCVPAGMATAAFLRTDELPGDAAVGYLSSDGLRTNVLHLPVRGSGDGGLYATVADVHALWAAVDAGDVVAPATLEQMVRPHGHDASGTPYGLGFWLAPEGAARRLEGADAGVSFLSVHDPSHRVTWTVVSNATAGAWAVARHLRGTSIGR